NAQLQRFVDTPVNIRQVDVEGVDCGSERHSCFAPKKNRSQPLPGSTAPVGLRYCIMLAPERPEGAEIAMKTIGLLGGMSWESSAEYYRLVNEQVRGRLGGLHSARCVLYSVDCAEIEQLQQQGDWDTAGELLAQAAHQLEQAGAELLVVCTNTMHRVAA